uniref:Equilibrative nucleoside transporter 1 n=1 Tax=Parastrongyloides trichosuri TaxID=131310 RepID=A0A0N4ZGL6_PARTI
MTNTETTTHSDDQKETAFEPVNRLETINDPTKPFLEGGENKFGMEEPPVDKYNAVYLIMLLHGIGVLMPWNMFITIAPSYFVDYKLTDHDASGDIKTVYALSFFSFLGLFSQLPNLLLNALNIINQSKGDLIPRITYSLGAVCVVVVLTIMMIFIDSTTWIATFFWITMISVAILNAANGIYQNSVYGLVAKFPPSFTNAIILGNNLAGTFVSFINILTIAFSDNVENAAFSYFAIALFTLVACFISIFMLGKFKYYRYYSNLTKRVEAAEPIVVRSESKKIDWDLYMNVLKESWPQMVNVFLVFFVTLTCFPAIMADVRLFRPNGTYDFIIPEKYFTPVTTFLLFNFLAAVGSYCANFKQVPGPKKLWIPVYLRTLFIPFFFFCNYRPELRTWPVFITNEWIYLLGGIVMSFTSGYLSSLGMMYAPRSVPVSKSSIAGMMSAFFLILGITSGIVFTFLVTYVADNLGPSNRLSLN